MGVGVEILRRDRWVPEPLQGIWRAKSDLARVVRECVHYLPGDLAADLIDRVTKTVVIESSLFGRVWRAERGQWEDLGLLGAKVVTNNGAEDVVRSFLGTSSLAAYRFHAIGSGNTAEAVGDTALVYEFCAQNNPGSL